MRSNAVFATLVCALALLAARAAAKPKPIMVWSGKLGPIIPALPTPPPPVPYPPIPPAPVWEDPEPGYNNLLTYPSHSVAKYGFRVKPLKTYLPRYSYVNKPTLQVPQGSYSKDFVYPYL